MTTAAIIAAAVPVQAQTCSCAGAPLLSAQSSGATNAGQALLGVTHDFQEISQVYEGGRRLDEESVARRTQTTLLEVSYAFTDRFSAAGTFTFVIKERRTGLGGSGTPSSVTTRGLGDGLVMARYVVIRPAPWRRRQLAAGAGLKLPLGTTSVTAGGLPLNMDMQPGTGSWDAVMWAYGAASPLPRSGASLFWSGSYRPTGGAARFGENDRYRFGNELETVFGGSESISSLAALSLQFRLRWTGSDRLNDVQIPNTGGWWLTLIPAVDISLSDPFSARLSGRIPLRQRVGGTQPTTSFALSVSLFANFNQGGNEFLPGDPR